MQPSETKVFEDFLKVGTFVSNDGSSMMVWPRLVGALQGTRRKQIVWKSVCLIGLARGGKWLKTKRAVRA